MASGSAVTSPWYTCNSVTWAHWWFGGTQGHAPQEDTCKAVTRTQADPKQRVSFTPHLRFPVLAATSVRTPSE